MINYLDRTISWNCSATKLSKENPYRSGDDGHCLFRLLLDLCAGADPGGMFLDRFGNKLTYALSIFFWSLFTLLQSFTLGLKSLLLLRLGLGVSEAPCFPANSRIVSTWFPQHERAGNGNVYSW